MHALPVDLPCALEYGPSSLVAITRVVLCKRREFGEYVVLAPQSLLVVKRCAVQLGKFTCSKNRASIAHEVVDNRTSLGNRQLFFANTSLSASTSSMRSASRRLSRPFSFSNSLRRCASTTLMPAYVLRQR